MGECNHALTKQQYSFGLYCMNAATANNCYYWFYSNIKDQLKYKLIFSLVTMDTHNAHETQNNCDWNWIVIWKHWDSWENLVRREVFSIEKQMEIVWLIWIGWKIKRFSRFINRWLKHIIFFLFISGCPNVFDADWLIRSDREKIDEKLKETKRKRTEIIGHGDVFVKGKSSLWRQLIQFNYTPNATMNATEWFVVRRYVCSVGAVIGDRVSLNIEKKIIVIDRICLRRQPEKKMHNAKQQLWLQHHEPLTESLSLKADSCDWIEINEMWSTVSLGVIINRTRRKCLCVWHFSV